jgi:hypothetical protein
VSAAIVQLVLSEWVIQIPVADVSQAVLVHQSGLVRMDEVISRDRDAEVPGTGFHMTVEKRDVGGIGMPEVNVWVIAARRIQKPVFLEAEARRRQ